MSINIFDNPVYFHSLIKFNHNTGIDLSDQAIYPFLSYKDGSLFEPNIENIYLFSFEKLEDCLEYSTILCVEENLINLFRTPQKIWINHHEEISKNFLEAFYEQYKSGYLHGMRFSLINELSESYLTLPIEHRLRILEDFKNICVRYSYFEGFATPACLFNIGFIQSYLFRACKEISLLNASLIFNKESKKTYYTSNLSIESAKDAENNSNYNKNKIPVTSEITQNQLQTLWSVLLLDLENKYPYDSIPKIISSKSELNYLLAQLFDFKTDKKEEGMQHFILKISELNTEIS